VSQQTARAGEADDKYMIARNLGIIKGKQAR